MQISTTNYSSEVQESTQLSLEEFKYLEDPHFLQ